MNRQHFRSSDHSQKTQKRKQTAHMIEMTMRENNPLELFEYVSVLQQIANNTVSGVEEHQPAFGRDDNLLRHPGPRVENIDMQIFSLP